MRVGGVRVLRLTLMIRSLAVIVRFALFAFFIFTMYKLLKKRDC